MKDGGPAFPVDERCTENYYSHDRQQMESREISIRAGGMTLRDYFAAKAMHAIIVGNGADICVTGVDGAKGTAIDAYVVADAMLAERDKERSKMAPVDGLPAWRDISCAPKDGTKILVCRATDVDGKPIVHPDFGLFVSRAAWWGEEEGWITYNSQVREQQVFFTPTHWMPIPEPPKI